MIKQVDGYSDPAFQAVERVFRSQLQKTAGGGAVCVYHRGRKVVDLWGGVRDDRGNPWQQDTLSVSFSTTKGVTATLLHQLVAEGKVNYDTPVSHYWPEFAENGKASITVRDLLTHRAGLYGMRSLKLSFEDLLDWDRTCTALAAAPSNREKAPYSVYHALTYGWLVGEVIRRAGGDSITNQLQEKISLPLGLDGCHIGVPDSEHHRVAMLLMGRPVDEPPRSAGKKPSLRKKIAGNLRSGLITLNKHGLAPDFSPFEDAVTVRDFHPRKLVTAEGLRAAMPAVNGTFTARSLARMYAALANGGELDGVRILDANMLPVISAQQVDTLDRALFSPMRWRLGYHQPYVLTRRRPRQAFGHFGFGGSGAWADPTRNLSIALTVNAGSGTPWGDMRILKLGAAALSGANSLR
ncbi:serine hydrolase domain-containing protein [Alcanivorax sp. 1008]|uniref:serine hydrolase domain-containing protein n=1 Tax=Alcanivorax sp. 1008 TaxID=2816853 RepID=UPI001DFE4069|nr:serine hydrolase domain-containing protein [Alcanivorax sp. 1008]MCC1497435.1 beta-lactamase family protein [Alcanivorax sp. 1008]